LKVGFSGQYSITPLWEEPRNAGDFYVDKEILSTFSEIAVCLFSAVDFKYMNDQDIIMDRENGTDVSADPERIYRMVWT
jgi:hypothetical protein